MTEAHRPAKTSETDPILAKRARFSRFADTGKRVGYSAFGLAIIAFVLAALTGFNDTWTTIVGALLLIGSVLLLPAIIIGYAVKAADRADLGLPDGH